MNFFQKQKQSLARDLQTMKKLSFKQKLRFLLDYYRGYVFAFFGVCLISFYLLDVYLETQRETVLEGFFSNDDENRFPAQSLAKEMEERLKLAPGQQVIFDDSLYVQLGSSDDYQAASQSKIVAYVSARELDFLVTTEELTRYYSKSFLLLDLDELLPPDLKEKLENQLYRAVDGSGQEKACAVSLAGSRFYEGADPDETAPHYLMALSYTEHQDALIQFLEYAFESSSFISPSERNTASGFISDFSTSSSVASPDSTRNP